MRTHGWQGVLIGCTLGATAGLAHAGPATLPGSVSRGDQIARPPSATRQRTRVAYLGVVTSPVDPTRRRALGLPEGVGLTVGYAEEGSPADAAGIRQGDVLHKLGDQ